MPAKKPMIREGISTRPTDKYGNRATNADLGIGPGADVKRKAAAMKIMAQEGTTSKSGGRAPVPAVRRITKDTPAPKPVKLPSNPNKPAKMQNFVVRTTTMMKPTPMGKKR